MEEKQEIQEAVQEDAMFEEMKTKIMAELEPLLGKLKDYDDSEKKQAAISSLSQNPKYTEVPAVLSELDKIISDNRFISESDIPYEQKYETAFALHCLNKPQQSLEMLAELYDSNIEFQDLIEKKRLEKVENGLNIPIFSPSTGAVSAALNIPEKPKTFEEAAKRTIEMFS